MKRSRRWRPALLAREAARNVLDPGSRHVALTAAALVLGVGLSTLLAGEWQAFLADLDDLRSQGRNVVVITPAETGGPAAISVESCSGLAQLNGVLRAGSARDAGSVDFVQLGPSTPIVEVSLDLLPSLRTTAAVVGASLASYPGPLDLGVTGTDTTLSAVVAAPEPSGMAGLNSSVAVPLPSTATATDTCIVELSRFADVTSMSADLLASVDVSGGEVAATPLLRESYDVVAAYRARPARAVPLILGTLGGLAAIALTLARGSELAAYRLSGTSRADLAALLSLEQVLVAGALVASASLGLAAHTLTGSVVQVDDVLWTAAAGLVWIVVAAAGSALVLRRSPADLARDR